MPSVEDLENRLLRRGTDSKKNIQERLRKAKKEISLKNNFDLIIMNDNILQSKNIILRDVNKFLSE